MISSCEALLSAANERGASDAVALAVCNEALFPTARPGAGPGWWKAELATLSPASLRADADQRALLEAVVDALPPAADAPLPASFLCRLLHAAVTTEASAKMCRDMELRVAGVLDQATAGTCWARAYVSGMQQHSKGSGSWSSSSSSSPAPLLVRG